MPVYSGIDFRTILVAFHFSLFFCDVIQFEQGRESMLDFLLLVTLKGFLEVCDIIR